MRRKTFPHGIHPPEYKSLTEAKALEAMPPPEKVSIPLLQHFGSPAKPLVKKGEEVSLGQKIGESTALFSASVHASVSGKVLSVDGVHHPLGKPIPAVTIANDGEDRPAPEIQGSADPLSLDPETICQIVKEAGIVGLGGAAFPTAVKLSPPKDKPIDTVIINGCECEPVLTADHRVMLEYTEDILRGAELVRKAAGAERTIIGIEDNKKDAVRAFLEVMDNGSAEIVLLKTKYPQGAEKNLINAILGREVPRGGLPFDVGVVVQNVGTAKAIWDAVKFGKPLYERALTAAGEGVREPKNLMVRIGTPFQDVLDFCGGIEDNTNVLIMGGPMMGLSQWSPDVPVIKGTSGILAWTVPVPPMEHSCIRCSRCVDHCPMRLVPTQLMKYVKYEFLSDAENWGILDCVECGSCQYICPAAIPLVHWIRLGKNQVMGLKRKKSANNAE
ncbi:MAG: electron transport complex subunit RsxC [Candidatus Aminicenantes bacterium]|jgi:electron transport complex protein RnfC|nr:electron transport complex subunit RsxC [Candidatus Aminicenantes bacterium]